MATFRKNNYVADLGAMVVTGLGKLTHPSKLKRTGISIYFCDILYFSIYEIIFISQRIHTHINCASDCLLQKKKSFEFTTPSKKKYRITGIWFLQNLWHMQVKNASYVVSKIQKPEWDWFDNKCNSWFFLYTYFT